MIRLAKLANVGAELAKSRDQRPERSGPKLGVSVNHGTPTAERQHRQKKPRCRARLSRVNPARRGWASNIGTDHIDRSACFVSCHVGPESRQGREHRAGVFSEKWSRQSAVARRERRTEQSAVSDALGTGDAHTNIWRPVQRPQQERFDRRRMRGIHTPSLPKPEFGGFSAAAQRASPRSRRSR